MQSGTDGEQPGMTPTVSEELLRLMVESFPCGLLMTDQQGTIEMVNAQTEQMFGYGRDELIGRPTEVLLPERYRRGHQVSRAGFLGAPVMRPMGAGRDLYGLHNDGREFPVEVSLSPVGTGQGIHVVCCMLDISARKRMEAQLFHVALRATNDAVWDCDMRTGTVKWHGNLQTLFGYAAEAVGSDRAWWADRVHPADHERVLSSIQVVMEGGGEFWGSEYRFRKADGSYAHVADQTYILRDEAGSPVRMTGSMCDVSELKQKDAALRESEARFHMLADTAPVLIWMAGADSRCVYFNKPWMDFTGRPIEQEVGDGWVDNVHPDDVSGCMETYRTVFQNRRPFTREYRLKRVDGDYRWMLETGVPRFSLDGAFAGYIGTCIDITERKLAEDSTRIALEQREALLKEIHHRVKNNLQIVSSLLNLQSNANRNKKVSHLLKECQLRVMSIGLLHETLYRSGNLSKVAMMEYIRALTDHLLRSYGVDSNTIAVTVDVDQIGLNIETALPCGLILDELLSNCLKHAFPEGRRGEIHVELRSNPDQTVTLCVKDNGVGIPDAVNLEEVRSLGLELVELFSDKLEGVPEFRRDNGTEFRLRFAELSYTERM
ncbi:MAG: PAS domain S-box protein [Nitrospira sp.]|nr:MAG: PAS domain S-box protein [Nitrospira sp.]